MSAAVDAEGERGETLVETLLTITIMGICFVAILFGIATAYMGTDTHRQESQAESVVRSYAERIQDPVSVPYVDCTTSPDPAATYDSAARTAGFTLPAGFTASITGVTFWDGSNPPAFGTCPAQDQGVQQVTVEVVSPHERHGARETLTVAKRRA